MPGSPFLLELETLPLFFRYRDVVFGRGFAATIETMGRALCVREDTEVVMVGVEPGGLAASGGNAEEAQGAFRHVFTKVLFDIAAESESFVEFKDAVERFVHETSPVTVDEWTRAVQEARRLVDPSTDVARQPAEAPASVTIVHSELAPSQNVISEPQHLVAA